MKDTLQSELKLKSREVSPIVEQWAEDLADSLYVAFESEKTDWQADSITPSGDPVFSVKGCRRKTDAELERFELVLTTSVFSQFDAKDDALLEIAFNLRSLIDDLNRVVDALENPPV